MYSKSPLLRTWGSPIYPCIPVVLGCPIGMVVAVMDMYRRQKLVLIQSTELESNRKEEEKTKEKRRSMKK